MTTTVICIIGFILRHCDVRTSTPHSSGFARLASGAFYFFVSMMTFCEFIIYVPS